MQKWTCWQNKAGLLAPVSRKVISTHQQEPCFNNKETGESKHTEVRSLRSFKATEQPLEKEAWMHHTVKRGHPRHTGLCQSRSHNVSPLLLLRLEAMCSSQGMMTNSQSPAGVKCKIVWLRPGRYPNNPRWLVSCSATRFHTSCQELVWPWIRWHSSPVKPKGWPGILSFDPGLKGAPVLKLRSHDWLFPPALLGLFLGEIHHQELQA